VLPARSVLGCRCIRIAHFESNRGIGRCIKAQRLNADGSPAAPYQPQEWCEVVAFERAIRLQGPQLPLAFDVDDAAVSCGSMFFPMQAAHEPVDVVAAFGCSVDCLWSCNHARAGCRTTT